MKKVNQSTPKSTIIIPCYNEASGIRKTLTSVFKNLSNRDFEVIVVNDGSDDKSTEILSEFALEQPIRIIENKSNSGYGYSLKKGILASNSDVIVITDADGTYPIENIPLLLDELKFCDMAVGARIGKIVKIPVVRRPAKWLLLKYAKWMAGADIKDLNSGLRAFKKEHAMQFFHLFPNGFSFTSTITLAMHVNGFEVNYLPINYNVRLGKSSINPIRDTIGFFSLVLRTTMYYKSLQAFGSLSIVFFFSAIAFGFASKFITGQVADVIVISLFNTSILFLGLGLVGDIINTHQKQRNLKR